MKKIRALVIGTLVVTGVAAVSFYAGIRVGIDQYLLYTAQHRAFQHAFALGAVQAGDDEAGERRRKYWLWAQEAGLNMELYAHSLYLESRLAWVLPELDQEPEAEKFIRVAARYRKQHPFEEESFSSSIEDPEFAAHIERAHAERKRRVEQMVARYGEPGSEDPRR